MSITCTVAYLYCVYRQSASSTNIIRPSIRDSLLLLHKPSTHLLPVTMKTLRTMRRLFQPAVTERCAEKTKERTVRPVCLGASQRWTEWSLCRVKHVTVAHLESQRQLYTLPVNYRSVFFSLNNKK